MIASGALPSATFRAATSAASHDLILAACWFGRASEQFANRNRIMLINGAELKQLVQEYLDQDVIPGTSPPRRLRASDNVQTGRPGPIRP